jgi:hypothetical protein
MDESFGVGLEGRWLEFIIFEILLLLLEFVGDAVVILA